MTSSFWIVNRPWYKKTTHPMHEEYIKYAELTPWEQILDEDYRKNKKKVIDWLVQSMPSKILIMLTHILMMLTH